MSLQIFIYIAISAGTGTAVVELLIKLFLSHWLDRQLYKFKVKNADKKTCSDEILNIINSGNYPKWTNLQDEIYGKAYDLSDRLITIGEEEHSKKLDEYISAQRNAQQVLKNIYSDFGNNELDRDFISTQHKIDKVRQDLVRIAQKLKK